MREPREHLKTIQRRVDFLKSRDHKNSFDHAELGSLEWALVNLQTERKPLPDGIPSPDELEALSDGNSGMIFNSGFPTKLDKLACWLREYAAIEAKLKENT